MKLVALLVLLFVNNIAHAGVYELSSRFMNPNKFPRFCWWGGSFAPKSEIKKKVEAYLAKNLAATGKIKLETDWPACESQRESEVSNFIAVLPFDDEVFDNPQARAAILEKHKFFEYYVFDHEKSPGHPRASGFGDNQNLTDFDLVLTFRFKNVKEGLVKQAKNLSPQGQENLILSIALHEALHLFGAVHEQIHPLSTCVIKGEEPMPRGRPASFYASLYISPAFDAKSVMSYCLTKNYNYELGPLSMSAGDYAAFTKAYNHF